tara:strand:- start:1448 stop:2056 length:609 start_codon:yes stop_codon:yes gene_type:complete
MIILDHEQGSEEWHESKLGKLSASNFKKLVTTKGEPSKQAVGYVYELIGERLTGESDSFYTNEHMERGKELESEARKAYEFIYGASVAEHGFILHDSGEYGCSPDGVIYDDKIVSGLEIKCPKASTMVKYHLKPELFKSAYFQQVQGCMLITGAESWDLFAYHPKVKPLLIPVKRDEEFLAKLQAEIDKSVDIILTTMEKIR